MISAQDRHRIIAIDGPAASGKSSVARELARRINFVYLNSGAIYRAITWHVLEQGVNPDDASAIAQLLESAVINCHLTTNDSRVSINDVDPTSHLRDERVNGGVSRVSVAPSVRRVADEQMHLCARTHDLVVEGRDIGSVVFPETPYKFYIDATLEVRARRRAAEGLRDEIGARDRADAGRSAAPLIVAKDAEVIDTSDLTIAGVTNEIIARLQRQGLDVDLAP